MRKNDLLAGRPITDPDAQISALLATVESKVSVKLVPYQDFQVHEIPLLKHGKPVFDNETGELVQKKVYEEFTNYYEVPSPYKEILSSDLALSNFLRWTLASLNSLVASLTFCFRV